MASRRLHPEDFWVVVKPRVSIPAQERVMVQEAGGEMTQAIRAATETIPVAARQQLVVVASLVGKAPNIAGLARTCEVLR